MATRWRGYNPSSICSQMGWSMLQTSLGPIRSFTNVPYSQKVPMTTWLIQRRRLLDTFETWDLPCDGKNNRWKTPMSWPMMVECHLNRCTALLVNGSYI